MRKNLLTGVIVTAVCLLGARNASAQSAFMLVPGVPGDSLHVHYADWIEVASLAQHFASSDRRSSACTVVVAKGLDKAGPLLWAAAVTGQTFSSIQIDVVRDGGKGPQKYYELTLSNVAISNISTQPLDLMESLTLAGTSATLSYFPQKPDGTIGLPVKASANCK